MKSLTQMESTGRGRKRLRGFEQNESHPLLCRQKGFSGSPRSLLGLLLVGSGLGAGRPIPRSPAKGSTGARPQERSAD